MMFYLYFEHFQMAEMHFYRRSQALDFQNFLAEYAPRPHKSFLADARLENLFWPLTEFTLLKPYKYQIRHCENFFSEPENLENPFPVTLLDASCNQGIIIV